jgi:hypothetical protein
MDSQYTPPDSLPPPPLAVHSKRRRSWWAWATGALIVAVLAAGGSIVVVVLTSKSTITPVAVATSAPPPAGAELAALIPTNYVVTKESTVRLNPSSPPLVVVTDAETQGSSGDVGTANLLLLAWDGYVHRWTTVFDGAQAPRPGGAPAGESIAQSAMLPSAASVIGLRFQTITPTPGRTDLVFWAEESFGANAQLVVGIIHYNGQTASLQYSTALTDPQMPSSRGSLVSGRAPHQTLHLVAGWVTADNSEAYPVRNYSQVVSWVHPIDGGSGYTVTSDTRSWLGVYAIAEPGSTAPTIPLVVVAVMPGSPAAGVLQPGDELLSVQGVAVPANANPGLGIIAEIAREQPGTPIALSIIRNGQQMIKNVTLSSYASSAHNTASAPIPGYLGIDALTDTPALAANYGLGTGTGAIIAKVVSGSPAAGAGLEADDVITAINGQPVNDAADLTIDETIAGAGTTAIVTYVTTAGVTQTASIGLGIFAEYAGPFVYGL